MLRGRVKLCVAGCFYYSGLVKFVRRWIRRSEKRLIILNYHSAAGGELRRHFLYLRRHYRILHLEEALQELYAPAGEEKRGHDRRTPLVLTFDDGYRDNYTSAFATARELRVPITIFLIPGYVESGKCFWWLEGDRLAKQTQADEVTIEGRTYLLEQERQALALAIYTRAYHARSIGEREAFLAEVSEELAVPANVTREEEMTLTWTEVREMEESGWVSFGAHTMHHPVLANLGDPAEVRHEVSACRTVIEERLGHPIHTFAYPLGRSEHIGQEGLRAVAEAGYAWAVTTIGGINTPQSDPYRLGRRVVGADRHWLVIAAETVGIWQLLSPLRKYSRVVEGIGCDKTT